MAKIRACALAFALSVFAAPASGQTRPSVDVRTWRPSIDPEAGLALEPAVSPGPWQYHLGVLLSYSYAPVVLRDAATDLIVARPLDHALGADLVAGIGLGQRAAVGVDVPMFLWQEGTSSLRPTLLSAGEVSTTGLGDVALLGKATIVSNDRQGVRAGLGAAVLAGVTLPTGDRTSFMGDGSLTASLRVLGEYAIGVGAVRAALGYEARTVQRMWPDETGGVTFGDEIPWSVQFVLRPKVASPNLDPGDRQVWEVGFHGSVPARPVAPFGLGGAGASALSPVLVAASDRIALGHYRDAYVLVGAELGLDRAVGVPVARGVLSFGWAPRPHDRDADGIADDADECPDLAEDKDGIQDMDGCPEDDADGDGVLDQEDACPLVRGAPCGEPGRNGCPDVCRAGERGVR